MKSLSISLLLAISLTTVYSDITGVWYSDWQNPLVGTNICIPLSYSIIEDASQFNVTYTFTSDECSSQNLSNYTSTLTQLSAEVWSDSNNFTLTYDPSTDTFKYSSSFNPSNEAGPFLYDRNGSTIPQDSMPPISTFLGIWANPQSQNETCLSSSDTYVNILVYPQIFSSSTYRFSAGAFYPQSTWFSYPLTNLSFHPDPQTPTWTLSLYSGEIILSLYPYNVTSPLLVIYSNQQCNYTYQLQTQNAQISGIWYPNNIDRTNPNPIPLEIDIVNNFMVFKNHTSNSSSFVFQLMTGLENQYFGPDIGSFTYKSKLNILVYTPSRFYSQNGSMFSNPPVLGNWTNPHTFYTQCCMPKMIEITNGSDISDNSDFSLLSVTYYFPDDPANLTTACSQILPYIEADTGVIRSDLYLRLNFTGEQEYTLDWSDTDFDFSYNVTFDTDATDYEAFSIDTSIPIISVQYQGCRFVMELESGPSPNPHPKPLISLYKLTNGLVLLIIGSIMILA